MRNRANRVAAFGTSIFTEITLLAQQNEAINLGQGMPDFDVPTEIVQQASRALHSGQHNQYAPSAGTTQLRRAIAEHTMRFYGLEIDPVSGVVVTSGASEGIFASILALVNPGDEVIVIEPYYESYVPCITFAGATPVHVPLRPPTWTLDLDELRSAFNINTRALILNSPQNPTGHIFTFDEMSHMAELCIKHDVLVISDEVYEHLTYRGSQHIPMATVPGMFERTLTVSSAAKSFSATGWKIGWVYGPPEMVEAVARAHQFITFNVHHPSQEAIAYALTLPDSFFERLRQSYETKLKLMEDALDCAGLVYSTPQGAYFVLADFSMVFKGTASEFAHQLITNIGVACIPINPFYSQEHAHLGQNYVRFAFCKDDDVLLQARDRLSRLRV